MQAKQNGMEKSSYIKGINLEMYMMKISIISKTMMDMICLCH